MTRNFDIILSPSAIKALDILESNGGEAWVVGGMVRDGILGNKINDADIACNMPFLWTKGHIIAHGWACHETGAKFGTVTAVIDGDPIEITTYRSDSKYLDNRHPSEIVHVSSIEEDLARRDFTINAMAYHPTRGLLDIFGGVEDLNNGILRCVGDPNKRLEEDALRILRGIRFCAQHPLTIEQSTLNAMRKHAHLLSDIAPQRIGTELNKLLCGAYAADCIMKYADILCAAIPELEPMVDCEQNSKYHIYDVLEHTIKVIEGVDCEPFIRWCALLHDSGKPAVMRTDSRGFTHFKGHEPVSASIARDVLTRLCYPKKLVEKARLVIFYHDTYYEPTTANVRMMLNLLQGDIDLMRCLLRLMVADSSAKAPGVSDHLALARQMIAALDEVIDKQLPYSQAHMAIKGSDLIAAGMKPGKNVGELLSELLEQVIKGEVENTKEALLYAAKQSSIFLA